MTRASNLRGLSLGPNFFIGDIQKYLFELTDLQRLSLRGLSIDGRLDESYGLKLTNLVELIISETYVEGEIPTSFSALTNLRTLDLSSNDLRNGIPELDKLQRLSK